MMTKSTKNEICKATPVGLVCNKCGCRHLLVVYTRPRAGCILRVRERIAAALNVDVAAVRRKRDLLTGICPEAVQLLKDKRVSPAALREVKRVGALRQIEMAELMISANNYSASYAKCLYAATPEEQKLAADRPQDGHGLSPEDIARMQRELANVSQDLKLIEETHGENVLNLVLAVGYLKSLIANSRVVKFLGQHYAAILTEFQKIVEAPELDGSGGT
jgi:hypothetical protein